MRNKRQQLVFYKYVSRPIELIDDALNHIRDVWHDESNAWLDCINDLVASEDPDAIQPLLCVWPFEENDDYHHWMFAVAHAVESYPTGVLAPRLAAAVSALNDTSAYFLEFLLGRWLNSPNDFGTLLDSLVELPPDQCQLVSTILEGIADDRADNQVAQSNWQTAKSRLTVA